MTEKQEALKPCPFCGGTNITIIRDDRPWGIMEVLIEWWQLRCIGCLNSADYPTKSGLINKWNTRALTEAPKVDVPFPPQCEICDRYVKQTSIRALGPGPQCCNDCYLGWYDGSPENNKQSIKKYVLDKYGETGGEGINLKEYIDHITTHYHLVKKEKKHD